MDAQEGHPVVKKRCSNTLSLTPLERECYEGEVQPYRNTDYKPMMMMSAALYMFVRYFSPSLPMCLRCFMLMLSGPV